MALALLGAAVAVLGVPLGLAWAELAPDVPVRVTEQGLLFVDAQPEQPAAADGWFALLAVPFGALVAGAAWLLAPRTRGPGAVVALAAGGAAAGLLAWWVGRQVGMAAFESALATAPAGTTLSRPADVQTTIATWWPPVVTGVPLTPALSAAVCYTLLAAWSRFPTLRAEPPGPQPPGPQPPGSQPPGPAGAPGP